MNLSKVTPIKIHQRILVLSDLHANIDALREALIYAKFNDCFVIQLGDLLDSEIYLENVPEVVDLCYEWVRNRRMICLIGNHDFKYVRIWNGNDQVMLNELQKKTLELMGGLRGRLFQKYTDLYTMMDNPYMFTSCNLRCAHAAIYEENTFRVLKHRAASKFLYGENDTKTLDSDGYPIRTYGWVDKLLTRDTINVVGHSTDALGKEKTEIKVIETPQDSRVIFLDCNSGKEKGGLIGGVELQCDDATITYNIEHYHKFGE